MTSLAQKNLTVDADADLGDALVDAVRHAFHTGAPFRSHEILAMFRAVRGSSAGEPTVGQIERQLLDLYDDGRLRTATRRWSHCILLPPEAAIPEGLRRCELFFPRRFDFSVCS